MTSTQRYRLAKWWLMEELRTLFLSGDTDMVVEYQLIPPTSPEIPTKPVQKRLLEQLAFANQILLKKLDDELYEVTWQTGFEKMHTKQRELVKNIGWASGEQVKFDDETATLSLGAKSTQLPPYKYEHQMCQVMFKYRLGEPVDTSLVYEEMMADDKDWDDQAKRMIKDTVRRINQRVDEVLLIPQIFRLEKNTIRRTF